jgi:opacity protein-like surface antigen
MKRISGILMLAFLLVLPVTGFAADAGKPLGVYVGGHLGVGIVNMSHRKVVEEDAGGIINPFSSASDTVFGGGVTLGYNFASRLNIPVRLELDYTARSDAKDAGKNYMADSTMTPAFDGYMKKMDKVGLQTLMANAWVDIPTGTSFKPYLGGGIGWGFIHHKSSVSTFNNLDPDDVTDHGASKTSTNFAWSLGGGLGYDLTQNWTVDLGYRYIDAGKSNVSIRDGDDDPWMKSKVSVQSHDIMMGLRYTF